jgi:dTMP kinase
VQLTQGILIAVEGIDGSGKSTLAQNLHTFFKKNAFETILTREPGASTLGKDIRKLICESTFPIAAKAQYLLFAADRAQHFADIVIPALRNNNLIISDRMADSSIAYQGYGNKLDLATIHSINQWSMDNITPDLTIFVRVPVPVGLARAKKRGTLSLFEQEEFLHRVSEGFETLYKNRTDVIIIDGTQSQEIITMQAYNAIEQWIHTHNICRQHNSGLDITHKQPNTL